MFTPQVKATGQRKTLQMVVPKLCLTRAIGSKGVVAKVGIRQAWQKILTY